MEVPDGGLGDLGDFPLIDVGDTPQQVGTTSERFLPDAVCGAGRTAGSRPRDAAEEGCCEDNSGTEGAEGEEEGNGRMAEGMERVEAVGRNCKGELDNGGEGVVVGMLHQNRRSQERQLQSEDNKPLQPGRCQTSEQYQCMVSAQDN